MTGPTFRVKPYAHPKYKFVVRAKLAGKWKRSYFKSEAEAAAYAGKQNATLEKQVKRQRSGRMRSDGHTNGASNWHELEKSNRQSTVSWQALSRKAVVVLGMHRSGTSALCGAPDFSLRPSCPAAVGCVSSNQSHHTNSIRLLAAEVYKNPRSECRRIPSPPRTPHTWL